MKTQECRWFEHNRYLAKPARPNPQETQASYDPIHDAEIRSAPAGSVDNQQLMFGENGFCNNGPHTAGPSDSH